MDVSTPKLFICYRREETAAHAGRLYDAFATHFGASNVFMDIELEPGIDFVELITQVVGACHVLLVMVGPRWATLSNREDQARITDEKDFVRLELETALRRPDVRVIPLLVGGARMPDADDLPEAVRALTRRNAVELSDLRWRYDVGRLVSTLEDLLATAAVPLPAPSEPIPVAAKSFPARALHDGARLRATAAPSRAPDTPPAAAPSGTGSADGSRPPPPRRRGTPKRRATAAGLAVAVAGIFAAMVFAAVAPLDPPAGTTPAGPPRTTETTKDKPNRSRDHDGDRSGPGRETGGGHAEDGDPPDTGDSQPQGGDPPDTGDSQLEGGDDG
jgi:TIR domain